MAETQTNTVILQVKLDEGQTEKQLAQLVLDIEKTKLAQNALNAERKAGKVADEEFAAQTVKLKAELKAQQVEQTGLTKNLELYRTASGDLSNTYKGTQAQLSLAQRQYQVLQESQNGSTESTKALGATIAGLRAELTKTDETQGLFVRNIGNYPKGESLEPLIQQLVHLQEVQKQLPIGSQAAAEAGKRIGFEYGKLNETAASAGLSQAALNNKLKDYGERIRPATTELAKLTVAQEEVARSAGKESEEFAKIGFQIGAARKEVAKVPPEISKINPAAEAATKALSDTANKGFGLLGEQGEKASKLLNTFNKGTTLVSQGMSGLKGAGETGALGFKAIAGGIALTGIGLFVIAITAVVSYFTQSAEGGKILAQVMGGLGAVVQVGTDLVIDLGRSIVYTVTHPIEAIKKMGTTLLDALLHPIDTARGLGNAVARLTTRITEAGNAGASLVAEQKALIVARRQLEIDEVREQSRVAVLIRLSKDRTLSSKEQLANLKEAGRVEAELTEKKIALEKRELAAIDAGIKQKGEGKAADLKAEKGAKEKEIAQTLAAQDEVNAKIKTRESIFIQAQRTAAAAAAKQRAKDAVLAKQTENELALLAVAKGSAAELVLKQRAIDLAADLAIAGEKKTAKEVALIRATAEGDKLDLTIAFQAKEIEEAKKRTAAQNAEVKREYEEAARLLSEYLDTKRADTERDFAAGRIKETQYLNDITAIDKAGLAAALVNAQDYGQDKSKILKAQADLEIREAKRVRDEKKKIEDAKQKIVQTTVDAGLAATDAIIAALGEETAAGQAALQIKKVLSLAEIGINLEKQLSLNAVAARQLDVLLPGSGIVYQIAANAIAISAAAAGAAKILGFREGGVLVGPSHEQGGIPFRVAGRPGFEAEGGEIILTKGVWDNPVLRPLASTLNVLGGGAPLLPRAHLALGGVTAASAANQLRGDVAAGLDYAKLAQAMSRVNVKATISDVKAGLNRDAQTQGMSNA